MIQKEIAMDHLAEDPKYYSKHANLMGSLIANAIIGGVGVGFGKAQKERGEAYTFGLPQALAATLLFPGGTAYQAGRYIGHHTGAPAAKKDSEEGEDKHDIWVGGKDPSITGKTAALNAFGVNAGISAALQAKRPMVQRGAAAMPTDVAAASAGLKQNNLYPSPAAASAAPLELDLTPKTFKPGGDTLAWSSPAQMETMPLRHTQMSGRKFASVYDRGVQAALEKFAALPLLAAAAPHLIRAGVGALAGGIGNKIQGGSFKGGLLPGAVGGVIPGIGGQVASAAAGALTNK
jgi:hypothetical protein